MFELNNTKNAPFVKKAHRPWDEHLLEQTVKNSEKSQASISSPSAPYQAPGATTAPNIIDNQQLKSELTKKTQEKEELIKHINNNKSNAPLSLGGFFQPTNMYLPNTSQNGQKINRLIHDLKSREQEITSITANLKISEAIEKAEQAEAIRITEENARIAAEKRMKQAIEQVNVAATQLGIAIEKAQMADQAQKEEERIRRKTEAELSKAIEQIRILEQKLKNELDSKKAAEDKAQISLNQTIQTELARQELEGGKKKLEQEFHELLDKYNKLATEKNNEEISKYELQQQFNRYQEITEHDKSIIEKTLHNFQFEQTRLLTVNDELHNQILGLEELAKQQTQQINSLENQLLTLQTHQKKLEQIIETEQNLRKLADQKANSALAAAAKAEIAKQEAEKQKKIIDEKAKRAVAHASKTVMKFLDSNSTLDLHHPEEKELSDNYLNEILK